VINQLRAFLLERGLTFAKTPAKLRNALPDILESPEVDLITQMRNLIDLLWAEWKTVEDQSRTSKGKCRLQSWRSARGRISPLDPTCDLLRVVFFPSFSISLVRPNIGPDGSLG